MKVPSLSRGCEIAPFFVRYMVNRTWHEKAENKTSITTKFECTIVDSNKGALSALEIRTSIRRTSQGLVWYETTPKCQLQRTFVSFALHYNIQVIDAFACCSYRCS